MPNTFIANREAWLRMSEVDYLGQFVKAWLAFNAWYRSAYTESQDRKIINEIKWSPNDGVGSKVRPLLRDVTSESARLRSEIGALHDRLEAFEIFAGKGENKERISFRAVYLKDNPPSTKTQTGWGHRVDVQRAGDGKVHVTVTRLSDNATRYQVIHPTYDPNLLISDAAFTAAPKSCRLVVSQFYRELTPKHIADLLSGDEEPIECGSFKFGCGPRNLYAGVIEVVYLLRNTLFHGELHPTKDALACYEPAYRLVRQFLDYIQ